MDEFLKVFAYSLVLGIVIYLAVRFGLRDEINSIRKKRK